MVKFFNDLLSLCNLGRHELGLLFACWWRLSVEKMWQP